MSNLPSHGSGGYTKEQKTTRPFPDLTPSSITTVQVSSSGPLPDAQSFALYEKTSPGAADRILALAEQEQEQRHKLELISANRKVDDMIKMHESRARGQHYALIISLAMLLVAVYLIYLGNPYVAACLSSLPIVGAITAFMNGKGPSNGNGRTMRQ